MDPILDAEHVRARAEAVLAEPLFWFPVRHHSPAVARHLVSAIRARRPRVLFVEAPSDATELVPHLVDERTKPPVAIYASYRDDANVLGLAGIASPAPDVPAKFASWYPMLPYSPEYVGIKEATALGARVVFIDLPLHGQLRSREERGRGLGGDEEQETAPEEVPLSVHDWDALAMESSLYQRLAAAAGYRSWNECWDALFEAPERFPDASSFRAELTRFCAAVRATTPPSVTEADGTLLREAHMWRTIAETLAAKGVAETEAMVVCGGFHLFMDRELGAERPLPPGTVYRTLTPYSYARTSELGGYGAGNRAPAFYGRLFDHALAESEGASFRAMVDHVVAVLARARKEGELVSSADAIAVTEHAELLAKLRGRSAPSLDDTRDALVSCCVKGSLEVEGRAFAKAMTTVETGSAVGRVTPELGRLPLVHDFYAHVAALDLGETIAKDARTKLTLDLRQPDDERRSAFFHRLRQLGIPYAELLTENQQGTLFREVWRVAWSPEVDAELAEQNLHGESVEAAALARFDEELSAAGQGVDVVTERILRAAKMDLPGLVMRLHAVVGVAVDTDARLGPLGRALSNLLLLEAHVKRRGLHAESATALVHRCYARTAFSVPYAANVPAEEHDEVVAAIRTLGELLLGERGESLDRALFVENVKTARNESKSQLLRGALSGVLTELRVQTTEELAAEIAAFAKARPELLVTCGEFLSGVLQTSRTSLLLGADALVAAIDELVRVADWEQFMVLLPRARAAFEAMHDRTRVSLADRVAVRYGLRAEEGDAIARIETSVEVAARLVELDAKVAEMMKAWDF